MTVDYNIGFAFTSGKWTGLSDENVEVLYCEKSWKDAAKRDCYLVTTKGPIPEKQEATVEVWNGLVYEDFKALDGSSFTNQMKSNNGEPTCQRSFTAKDQKETKSGNCDPGITIKSEATTAVFTDNSFYFKIAVSQGSANNSMVTQVRENTKSFIGGVKYTNSDMSPNVFSKTMAFETA